MGESTGQESVSEEVKKRRREELAECFAVIDTCLGSYYRGATHMYRPLAGQLRIVLCDKPPLLTRVIPNLRLGALAPIKWVHLSEASAFDGDVRLGFDAPPEQEFRFAEMPFRVTEYENGLEVADLRFDESDQLLPLDAWMDQTLTVYPLGISPREIIRSVANKGGGAHVDDKLNDTLWLTRTTGPSGLGAHVLFTVAVGRCVQKIGRRYAQLFGASRRNEAQAPEEPDANPKYEYAMTVGWRIR
jgi:hypothetical protein